MANRKKDLAWAPAAATAATLALGRTALGLTAVIAPGRTSTLVLGPASGPARPVMAMAGARDAAIGVGLLHALYTSGRSRSWVLAGVACDAIDAVIAVRERQRLDPRSRTLTFVAAAAGTAAGLYAATLD